jgi:two-component system phosphate regulon sensor histidine kinase PhoR
VRITPTVWQVAWQFLLAVLGGMLFGLLLHRVALGVALALAAHLAWNLWQMLRFEQWLRRRRQEMPPDASGPWGEIIGLVTRLYRLKQFHKRRVVHLFREFRQMTTAMPDGVVVLAGNDEIQWFNRQAALLVGLRRKADFGRPVQNLVRHPEFVQFLERARLAERGAVTAENAAALATVVIPSPLDTERRLLFHLIAAYGSGQRLLLVRDVTREARLESMRKDFVANASHELRSPLTVVAGYLDNLAEDSALEDSWRVPVEEMRRQTVRMREIVEALLELSRLEAAGGEAPLERVDVGGLVALLRRDTMASPTPPAAFEVEMQPPALLLGAPGEVQSILSNLVTNAVKYTQPEGRLSLRWWVDAAGGHLAVADTGIGIPAEHLPRLTERFYRVDPGRSRKQGGTGLGLAIVKHAVQRHGGSLQIESVDGRGSTFTCHFPLRRVPPAD